VDTHSLPRISELKEFFKDKTIFTIADLRQYYQRVDTDFVESTLKWRIHDIKKREWIRSVKRGVYTFQSRDLYLPVISSRLKKRYKEIKKEFPYTACCVWETRWLNELMNHQPDHFMDVLEIENKEAAQAVFYFLQQQEKREKLYFNPSEKEITQYLSANRQNTIIRPLITQAPTQEHMGLCIPKLEKILVDLFVDQSLFIAYQGHELITIYKNAYQRFPVNISTLLRYAQRRKKKELLTDFLLKNEIIPRELID
jgi:hypothetical protein